MTKVKKCPCGAELYRNRTAKTFMVGGHTIKLPRSGEIECGSCKTKTELVVDRRKDAVTTTGCALK